MFLLNKKTTIAAVAGTFVLGSIFPAVASAQDVPDEIPYEFAFAYEEEESDREMRSRLYDEASDYCDEVTTEAGASQFSRACTREVVMAVSEEIDDREYDDERGSLFADAR